MIIISLKPEPILVKFSHSRKAKDDKESPNDTPNPIEKKGGVKKSKKVSFHFDHSTVSYNIHRYFFDLKKTDENIKETEGNGKASENTDLTTNPDKKGGVKWKVYDECDLFTISLIVDE